MGRAEAFAVKNPVKYSLVDGFASGMGYMFVLIFVSIIREFLAFGSILNFPNSTRHIYKVVCHGACARWILRHGTVYLGYSRMVKIL